MKTGDFKKQYDKDFSDFLEKNKDMRRAEIILTLSIPVPLKKNLIKPSLFCIFSFYLLFILLWTIPFFAQMLTNDILNTICCTLISMTLTGISFVFFPVLCFNLPVYLCSSKNKLLITLFDHQKATQDLINCMEKSCPKKNQTVIMYQLLNRHSPMWEKGTNGRLKGFIYKKTIGDYGFLEEIKDIDENMRMQMEDIESQKKSWQEKQRIEESLKNIEVSKKARTTERL